MVALLQSLPRESVLANQTVIGDCRETLRRWAVEGVRVQTCVTSPPYFGLRDYGHAGQLGLEETPEQYVANMVEVFRCVRDVLADDGTLWLNIGDSYNAYNGNRGASRGQANGRHHEIMPSLPKGSGLTVPTMKNKDLIGIPWMIAFALRADGWCLRQDIIWHKPNPMPESVRDRCTKAHEYLFLLSKSDRYYFDSEAMKEPAVWAPSKQTKEVERAPGYYGGKGTDSSRNDKNFKAIRETRNRRSVWSVATSPYKGAHFATFPPMLIEPCILAGSRPGDIVLDPFMGSGTTAEVAERHGRRWLGCELNPAYAELQSARLAALRGEDPLW